MPTATFTKDVKSGAISGGRYGYHKWQFGIKATGIDRSRPQPYELHTGVVQQWAKLMSDGSLSGATLPTARSIHPASWMDYSYFQVAQNKAFGRLAEAVVGETSSLGAAFAEWRSSLGMIYQRADQLRRAYRALRRGEFRRFLDTLSLRPNRRDRGRVRNAAEEASGLWREYWFGWSPLVSDLTNACFQLSEPLPSGMKYRGRANDLASISQTVYGDYQKLKGMYKHETGATFSLSNPNLFLANQLGLVNPATVAWEVVPFSFVADWFFDVGSFLDSFTVFAGLSVTDSYRSHTLTCWWEWKTKYESRPYKARQVFMHRRQGLTRPLPTYSAPKSISEQKTRAASAVSLLIQAFKS